MKAAGLDESLIAQMALGESEAFRQLYLATSSIVYGYALSILKSKADAEDVMHDTFIRAYQNAVTYQPQGKPLAWLLTIVRNLCYNRLRQNRPTVDLGEYEGLSAPGIEQTSVDRIVLRTALRILDLQERQIVILHALTGLKHREIAELLDMPIGTVLSKYHRALKRLKTELEGKGEEQ